MDPSAHVLRTTILRRDQKGFLFSLSDRYPDVWEQNLESCVTNSMTHMLTIIHRKRTNNKKLQLSPNALLSIMTKKGIDPFEVANIIISGGLEEQDADQPLFEVVRNFQYKTESTRYKVKKFEFVEGHYQIVQKLKENFGPGGRRYPLIGFCYPMGSFAENEVASRTCMDNPYRWGAFNSQEDIKLQKDYDIVHHTNPRHAMLITGLSTTADNPKVMDFGIETKNSWGVKWGIGGLGWVTPDIFEAIGVPTMEGDQ